MAVVEDGVIGGTWDNDDVTWVYLKLTTPTFDQRITAHDFIRLRLRPTEVKGEEPV